MTRFQSIVVLLGIVAPASLVFAADEAKDSLPAYETTIKPFFAKNCFACHGSEDAEGEMRLDQLSPVVADEHSAETWQEILDVLNAGEMPPEDEKQPNRDELASVIGVLTDGLFEARKRLVDSRHVTLRRLNKREYANTIRDLLGVPIDTKGLPADGTVEGFDTIGDAHFMSTVQFEKYLELARQALDRVLVAGPRPERTVHRIEPEHGKNRKAADAIEKKKPSIAEHEAKLRDPNLKPDERKHHEQRLAIESDAVVKATGYLKQPAAKTGSILDISQAPFGGKTHDKVTVSLPNKPSRDESQKLEAAGVRKSATLGDPIGKYIARFRVGLTCLPKPGQRLFVELVRQDQFNQQVSYSYPLGTFEVSRLIDDPHTFEVQFENLGELNDNIAVVVSKLNEDLDRKPVRRGKYTYPDSTAKSFVWVDWMEVEGPILDDWPPAAWTQTFFKGLPSNKASESAYAREIIERFAFRAFRRRKPSAKYVDQVHGIFLEYRNDGASFVDAVKESLAVVLASPSFVYLVEQPSRDSKGSSRLSDLELASRLSYFLWSQPPDEELYKLAEAHRLSQPVVLSEQVNRMLGDPKARQFIEAFTSQWLDLPWLDMIVVNDKRFPEFNEPLRRSFREETVQFLGHLIQQDLSVTNLIDSDFVFIDSVLDEFYGLDAGSGNGFKKVMLPKDSPRGGLLGQGSILTMTSTGERTSPVERGVFVYERLLGRPVPPPPPNVPQLEISSEKPLTIRETLRLHIEKAQCASCHRRMDPLGFGLEHFNAIGQWRDSEVVFMMAQAEEDGNSNSDRPVVRSPRRKKNEVESAEAERPRDRKRDTSNRDPEKRDARRESRNRQTDNDDPKNSKTTTRPKRNTDQKPERNPNRTRRGGNTPTLPIDATGVMPDGKRSFDGHEQLKAFLMEDADGLANGMLKSMLTYALGRRVGFADREFVERTQAAWKQEGYGMRKLIHAIVQSNEFQTK